MPAQLRLNAREKLMTRAELTGWSIPVSVGIVSLVLSWSLPIEKIVWSGWVYFSMVILVTSAQVLLQPSTESERDSKLKKAETRDGEQRPK